MAAEGGVVGGDYRHVTGLSQQRSEISIRYRVATLMAVVEFPQQAFRHRNICYAMDVPSGCG